MSPVGSRFVQLPGLRMHCLTCGPEEGPLVVLLHGFPELSESWREVMPLLAEAGLCCVAPDLRGYGQTDVPEGGYDLDTLAGDVAALIDALRPGGRAHVVGHDWGGAIAYHLAAVHPERVERLAVVNCPPPQALLRGLQRPAQLRRSWYIFFFQLPWLPEYLLSRRQGTLVARMLRAAAVDRTHFTRERLAPYAANFARREVAHAALAYYRQLVRRMLRPSGLAALREPPVRIAAPFRLVWGEEDVALGRELTLNLEPFFVHPPEVRYLPGVGHFAPIEAPEKVASLVREHLMAQAPQLHAVEGSS